MHPSNSHTINFDSAGSIGIVGSFHGSSFIMLPNVICNDATSNLCLSKDGATSRTPLNDMNKAIYVTGMGSLLYLLTSMFSLRHAPWL